MATPQFKVNSIANNTQYNGGIKGGSGMDLTYFGSNASPSNIGDETPMVRNISPLGQMLDRADNI